MTTTQMIQTRETDARELVLDAIDRDTELADSTKLKYTAAVRRYTEAGHSLGDPDALARYAETVSASERAFLSAAVRKLAKAIEGKAKASATPQNVNAVQATVYRAEALMDAITVKKSKGELTHTWLSQAQVKDLIEGCDTDTLKGLRDRLALGLLVAAGLRRKEAVELTFDQVETMGNGRTVLQIEHGKGDKARTVPVNDGLADAIREWKDTIDAEDDSNVIRSFRRGGHVNGSDITPKICTSR